MLRLVGHPVAVNPDAELARIAAQEGWDVLRFEQLRRKLLAVRGARRHGRGRCRRPAGAGAPAKVTPASVSAVVFGHGHDPEEQRHTGDA